MRINSICGNFHPKSNMVSFKQIDLSDEYKNDLKGEGVLYDNPEDAPIQTWNIPRSMSRAVKALRDQKIDLYDEYFTKLFELDKDTEWGRKVKKKYDEFVNDVFGEEEKHNVNVIITDEYSFFKYPNGQLSDIPDIFVMIPSLFEDPIRVRNGEKYCHWALPKYDEIREAIAGKLEDILFPSPYDPPYVKPEKKTDKN